MVTYVWAEQDIKQNVFVQPNSRWPGARPKTIVQATSNMKSGFKQGYRPRASRFEHYVQTPRVVLAHGVPLAACAATGRLEQLASLGEWDCLRQLPIRQFKDGQWGVSIRASIQDHDGLPEEQPHAPRCVCSRGDERR